MRRAVLVVAGSILDAEEIKARIKVAVKRLNIQRQIRTLMRGTDEECSALKNVLTPTTIVIATVLASRGVDLEINDELANAGGLFVIIGFPPPNKRVEEQVFGRTARNGLPGSGAFILYLPDVEHLLGKASHLTLNSEQESENSVAEETEFDLLFEELREQKIDERLRNFESDQFPLNQLRATLFKQACATVADVRRMCEKSENIIAGTYAELQFTELWAFWLDNELRRVEKVIATKRKANNQIRIKYVSFLNK